MVVDKTRKIKDLLLGLAIGGLISLVFTLHRGDILTIPPFENVETLRLERANGYLMLDTAFTKNRCDIQYVEVFGESFDTWERLSWISNTGNTRSVSVSPGQHRYAMLIELPENANIDRVEVRTRHECGVNDRIVDSIFWSGRVADATEVDYLDVGSLP